MENKIKVIELFAGVGGFRLGLEGWKNRSSSSQYKEYFESPYEVVWSNQWEPSTKVQHASSVYEKRWNDTKHSNKDISTVDISEIPDHDMLVGGFPCQDYSVATTLKNREIISDYLVFQARGLTLYKVEYPPDCELLERVKITVAKRESESD
jgi:DNA (cytosine-5)-methyltransferase 1